MRKWVYWFSCAIIGFIIGYEILSLWEVVSYHLFKTFTQGIVTFVLTIAIVALFYWMWNKFIVDENTLLVGYIITASTVALCSNYIFIVYYIDRWKFVNRDRFIFDYKLIAYIIHG